MRLKAGCEIKLSAKAPTALVAMLRPRSGPDQWVASEKYELDPFVHANDYVDGFGNLCQRMIAPAGPFTIRTEVEVETAETILINRAGPPTPPEQLPDGTLVFLLPSRYCPSDRLRTLAAEVVVGARQGYDQVDAIVAWIREHIEYKYGVSNESTSALETIQDEAGVCRDFAHIGVSLCRALHIPARMVVGYLYKLDPMDLHAWFEAFIADRWYTFDATQAEPRGGRITLAYGRDAADVALITELGAIESKGNRVWVESMPAPANS